MSFKTQVKAGEGQQDILITRDFDLPVELLFKAYTDAELLAQWMGSRVVQLDCRRFGSWALETSNADGQVVFQAHGCIHECIENRKIVRTFEMPMAPFDVQLEFIEFESLSELQSRLRIHQVFRNAGLRDQMLALPFEKGLHLAHNRLQSMFDSTSQTQVKN